ncbi:MAG: response regulator transcription factor [Luteolibacter sp.]|uniref:response regulator transcription factor n=1 Tax=Luteolibacter sp. TaxID=1962973 RepID=UPI00326434ED
MPSPEPIRLMLVDDHAILRAGLANMLNSERGLQVVVEADDGESALRLWREHRPDVTLLDLSMGGMDGIEVLQRLRAEDPDARVLMLTSSEAQEDVRHALEAGASGYVTKNIGRTELVEAIRECHAGGRPIGKHVARLLEADHEKGVISRREMEVLGLVRQGFTNAEIGRLLNISERTAKAHVAALLVKLQASDRAEAVARGFERGLLKP